MRRTGRRHFLKVTGTAMAWANGSAVGLNQDGQPPANRKYRVAVIGDTGRGGYGHGLDKAFLGIERAQIVALADPSEEGRRRTASLLKVSNTYSDYRRMLKAECPDIVSVGPSWLNDRVEMVSAVAEAGAHILCEKPFVSTLREADQIAATCRRAGIKLAMAHQWTAAPPVHQIIREIRAGKYGKLLRAHIRPKDDARGGGHELILHGTHHFTLMFRLAGWPRWIFGNVQVNGRDITREDRQAKPDFLGPIAGDSVSAVIGFDNGMRVFFDSTAGLAVEKGRPFNHLLGVTIECEKKRIQLRSPGEVYLYDAPTVLADHQNLRWKRLVVPDWHFTPEGKPNPQLEGKRWRQVLNNALADDLIDAIERDQPPLSSLEHAVQITEIVQGVYASHFSGRRVDLPLKDRVHPLEIGDEVRKG